MILIGTEMLSKNSCEPVTKTMNNFTTSDMRWNSTEFIPKFKNFYGCDLKVGLIPSTSLGRMFLKTELDENHKTIVTGLSTALLPFLKQVLNIGEIKYEILRDEDSFYKRYDLLLIYYRIILTAADSLMKSDSIESLGNYAETYPIYYQEYEIFVTKGLSYTPMEKLLLPFDLETWIMIIVTFAIGFLTIFIIYRCNRFVQRFVFGTFVRDPSLTLTSIFFGIGVTRLPTRNFSRYLLMVFTLYCLIIRTAYQGKMYEFLNKDIRRPTAKTIDDIANMKIPVITRIDLSKTGLSDTPNFDG
jgi:hypothetical protein